MANERRAEDASNPVAEFVAGAAFAGGIAAADAVDGRDDDGMGRGKILPAAAGSAENCSSVLMSSMTERRRD